MTVDPKTAELILTGIIKAQQALSDLMTTVLPVLQNGSEIIAKMKADGHEVPTEVELAVLRADAAKADAAAQAAIDTSASQGN